MEEVAELQTQVKRLERLGPMLESNNKKLMGCEVDLEERVETRTYVERIINKQLHSEIEHRKKLEAELNEKSQLLETILSGITEQIILLTKDFKIKWANKTFLEQFGLSIEDISGKYCYEVTHKQHFPCQPPNDICPIAQVLQTGSASKEVHVHEGQDGKFLSEVSAYPIKNKAGEVIEFVHISRDIGAPKKETG